MLVFKQRYKMFYKTKLTIIWICVLISVVGGQAWAAPYFYLDGDEFPVLNIPHTVELYLSSEDDVLTATQTIIGFDETYFDAVSISVLNSACSYWAPADPALGYGLSPAPYFKDGNKVVIACGFSNPGYQSSVGTGDIIARIKLLPKEEETTSVTIDTVNTSFSYIASAVTAGAMSDYDLYVLESTDSATPTPIPDPNSTPIPTLTPDETDFEAVVFSVDDLSFVEIGTGVTQTTTTTSTNGTTSTLEPVDIDDDIPKPPADLKKRASATPFVFKKSKNSSRSAQDSGEVLAAQSLRELLIPGQSDADKKIVLFNLVSSLTFVTLLAIALWRLLMVSRMNKLKSQHMKEFLTSELSTLETKMLSGKETGGDNVKSDISQTVEAISSELNSSKKKPKAK